ncbi:MAG: hypothetical protein DRJ40_11505 [Thermoprotei archaeon]|nr:MAG: hypothetical protein DRJ40_11505 [Thermoprotei archaeon]
MNVRMYTGVIHLVKYGDVHIIEIAMTKKEAEEFIDTMLKLWYPVIRDYSTNRYYIPLLNIVVKVIGDEKDEGEDKEGVQ